MRQPPSALRRRRLALCLAVLLTALVTGPAAAMAEADTPREQWRSSWVDAFNDGIYTPAQVETLVSDALAVGANARLRASRRPSVVEMRVVGVAAGQASSRCA